MKFATLSAAIAISMSGSLVSAATFNFDTDVQRVSGPGSTPGAGPIVYATDGITVEATGWHLDTGGSNRGETEILELIAQYNSGSGFGGLGVCSSYVDTSDTGNCNDGGADPEDRHLVDGYGDGGSDDKDSAPSEGVFLAFDHLVRVTGVTFSYWDTNDEFDFHIYPEAASVGLDPSFRQTGLGLGTSPTSAGQTRSFDLTSLLTENVGRYISFAAFDNNDEWKLKAVTVEKVSEVPVPAAGFLLLAGLGGLGVLRGRKKQS